MEEAAANTGETDRRNVGDSLRSAAKFRRGDCRRGNRLDKRESLVRAQYRPTPPGRRFFRDRGLAGVSVGKEVERMSQRPFTGDDRGGKMATKVRSDRRGGAGIGTPPAEEARQKAESGSGWYAWLARGGLLAKGASYALVAVLAIGVAIGTGGATTSRQGALEARSLKKTWGQSRPRHAGCRVCRVCDLAFRPGLCRARGWWRGRKGSQRSGASAPVTSDVVSSTQVSLSRR